MTPNPAQPESTPAVDSNPSSLEALVTNHPVLGAFRNRANTAATINESRSPLLIPPQDLPNNLTSSTLAGPDMLSEPPYVFTNDEAGTLIAFYRLGSRLAGHRGIVHGGIAAVLLDECMGRACFPLLKGKIGVTAQLDIKYRGAMKTGSDVLVRAETTEVEGRKAWVRGWIEDARSGDGENEDDGKVLVEATALFIEPRWAADMPRVM